VLTSARERLTSSDVVVVHGGPMKNARRRGRATTRTNPRLGFQPSPILRANASERKKRSGYSCGARLGASLPRAGQSLRPAGGRSRIPMAWAGAAAPSR
jgi:hypothetical protein